MRSVPASIQNKLSSRIQTQAANANIDVDISIGRPTTPLTDNNFLEREIIPTTETITDVSIAVSHPKLNSQNTSIAVCYIQDGIARVKAAAPKIRVSSYSWVDLGFQEAADYVSIAYDGTFQKTKKGTDEFITESMPWIFWAKNGVLKAKQHGSDQVHILAESNCTSVSAIRAAWSQASKFNYGLVVFFLLNGSLYYRQLINGVWYDAETVTLSGVSASFIDIAAFRTWDYRIGVQIKDSDGNIRELFSQFMGIGTRSAEHLEISSAYISNLTLTEILASRGSMDEHLEITSASNISPYGGCYELGPISIISVCNVADSNGDWGTTLIVEFDKEVNMSQVTAQIAAFTLTDSNGNIFYPSTATMNYSQKKMSLIFISFGNAVGSCTLKYTPGTVSSMAGELLPETSIIFTPTNLVPIGGLPEVTNIWNE